MQMYVFVFLTEMCIMVQICIHLDQVGSLPWNALKNEKIFYFVNFLFKATAGSLEDPANEGFC